MSAPVSIPCTSEAARSPDEVLRALSPGHAGHAEPSDEANDGGARTQRTVTACFGATPSLPSHRRDFLLVISTLKQF